MKINIDIKKWNRKRTGKKAGRSKKRKNSKIPLSLRGKIIILSAALFMVVCVFTVIYIIMGSYDGLGLRHNLPGNSYDMDAFYKEGGRLYYEDEKYTSVTGIDVSYYQKKIDWERVKADGIEFAMIRLGYRGSESGDIQKDSRFRENVKGARKAGLDIGVYFFSQATTAEEAIAEARYVVRHIRGKGVSYPVAFDMEPVNGETDRISGLSVKERTEIADAFCKVIERNGFTPVIYGNPHWLDTRLDLTFLTNYEIWLAHYTKKTDYPYAFRIWQYSDRGKVDGIKGRVDLNIMMINK
ncbi:glycoside hydrolase family 25 protein [Ihubacter sp. mB4P-1]|uniref:glycoside hydrolase family 25 protein n=1 Tax=Ihubacter sp. mB4P-1 TaxID=3242370 RepID=UPI003C79A626